MAEIKFTDLTKHLIPPVPGDVLVTAKEDVDNGGLFVSMVTLHHTTASIVGSNLAAAVGEFYDLTLAGMTADRLFVLPDTAKVGERIAWFTNDGDATQILKLATAAAGSLFEGVDISAGSDKYCYFIAGEAGCVVCVKAGGAGDTDWRFVPGGDGRIAIHGSYVGQITGVLDTTFTVPDLSVLTEECNIGACGDTTNDYFLARRVGNFVVDGACYTPSGYMDDQEDLLTQIQRYRSAAWVGINPLLRLAASGTSKVMGTYASLNLNFAINERARVRYRQNSGATQSLDVSTTFREVL